MKPVAPRTDQHYRKILHRAYGDFGDGPPPPPPGEVASWPESVKKLFRAAYSRACEARGHDPRPGLARVPRGYRPKRQTRIPAEREVLAYEAAARELAPVQAALALLPLALGMRAEEVCALSRDTVKAALKTGVLTFTGKGAKERSLPAKGAEPLLRALLEAPRAAGRRISDPLAGPKVWQRLGEILSPGVYHTQYQRLHRLVRSVGKAAGLEGFRPHLLRHAFASRLHHDGADQFRIMAALGHNQIETTAIYVHPTPDDIAKHTRQF